MSVLVATPRVRWIRERIKRAAGAGNPMTNDELLTAMNEGYQRAVERGGVLATYTTLSLTPGTSEYSLPPDLYRTKGVYRQGQHLLRVSENDALQHIEGPYYYQRSSVIGFPTAPTDDGFAIIRYIATPEPLGLDDTPLWGREWDHLLYRYGLHRVLIAGAGAEQIPYAAQQRQLYDAGVKRLATQVRKLDRSRQARILFPSEVNYAR